MIPSASTKLANSCLYPRSGIGPRCELEWSVIEEGVQVPEGVVLKGSAQEAAVAEGN